MDPELVAAEEAKRERMMSAQDRWRMILEAIRWADAQQPLPRNHPKVCKAHEARVLAALAGAENPGRLPGNPAR